MTMTPLVYLMTMPSYGKKLLIMVKDQKELGMMSRKVEGGWQRRKDREELREG
jgi:hypothetical protein